MPAYKLLPTLIAFIAFYNPSIGQTFHIDSTFLKQTASFKVSSISGVATDKKDNFYILHRADRIWNKKYADSKDLIQQPVIFKNSKEGKLVDSFGRGIFIMPHMISVDGKGNMWVADVWLQQVIKMNKNGTVLLTAGEKFKPGSDSLHFDLPADIAVLKDKSFYVADGYGNSRIIKFTKEGALKYAWGKRGKEGGEFHTPHSIAIFNKKIFVADRENSRLQVFDLNGKLVKQFDVKEKLARLFALAIDKKGNIYLTGEKGTSIFSSDLIEIASVNARGHDIAVDSKGVIYLAGGKFIKISKVLNRKVQSTD